MTRRIVRPYSTPGRSKAPRRNARVFGCHPSSAFSRSRAVLSCWSCPIVDACNAVALSVCLHDFQADWHAIARLDTALDLKTR